MDRTNWSIRALLYSHNQHKGLILGKMILDWMTRTVYTSNSFSSISVRTLPEYFPIHRSHFKKSFPSENHNLLKNLCRSFIFVDWSRPSIFQSNTPFWRSNTALDGPLINQSNHLFLSGWSDRIYCQHPWNRKQCMWLQYPEMNWFRAGSVKNPTC